MVFLGLFESNRNDVLFNNTKSISQNFKTLRFNVEIMVSPVEDFFHNTLGFQGSHHAPHMEIRDLSVFVGDGVEILSLKTLLF
jgi:ribosomal protein L6P/L9E